MQIYSGHTLDTCRETVVHVSSHVYGQFHLTPQLLYRPCASDRFPLPAGIFLSFLHCSSPLFIFSVFFFSISTDCVKRSNSMHEFLFLDTKTQIEKELADIMHKLSDVEKDASDSRRGRSSTNVDLRVVLAYFNDEQSLSLVYNVKKMGS